MTIRARNLYLTLACFVLVAFALKLDGLSDATRTALITAAFAFITGLWMRSSRGPAAFVPLACLASLALGACRQEMEWHWPYEQRAAVASAPLSPAGRALLGGTARSPYALLDYGPQAGLLVDLAEFRVIATPTCTAGRACLYADNANNLLYTKDGNDLVLKLHAAQSFRTAADCTALAAPANGDVCYSTGLGVPQFYAAGWTTTPVDSLVVHLAGSETITGAKNFTGNVTLGDAAADAILLKGTFGLYNAAVTFASTITTLATAARAVVFPDAAGTVVLDGATQTLTNKSISASQINSGALAVARGGTNSGTALNNNRIMVSSGGGIVESSGCSDGQALIWASGVPTCSAPAAFSAAFGGNTTDNTAFGAATAYLAGPGSTATPPASQRILYIVTRAGTIGHLAASIGTAPGGADTVIFTAQKSSDFGGSWSNTTLTCTITGAAKVCTDTTHAPAVALYDWIALKLVSSAGTATGPVAAGAEAN